MKYRYSTFAIFKSVKNRCVSNIASEPNTLSTGIIIGIVVGIIVLIVVVFLILSYAIPSLRAKIFPHYKRSKEIKKAQTR